MHVVSVCHHYGNIIWLPLLRPLTDWKIRYRSIICLREIIKKKKLKRNILPYYMGAQKINPRNAWQSIAYGQLCAVMSPPSEYLSKTLTYWPHQCLPAPPRSGCSWSKCCKIFDADRTTSHVVVTEPNLTEISHTVENWWPIKALKSEFQYSNLFSAQASRIDDDRQTGGKLLRYFHLLGCSPQKLQDRSSPKFYRI